MSDSIKPDTIFEGQFYDAVDIGKDGGRYAVVRKGVGVVLMTAINRRNPDEAATARDAAKALDAQEQARRAPPRRSIFRRWW